MIDRTLVSPPPLVILATKEESMRKSLLAIVAITLLASLSVQAQNNGRLRYKWQDVNGLVHFSDSLTTEAMQYGYDVVNDRGLIVRRVPRQLTAAERAVAN